MAKKEVSDSYLLSAIWYGEKAIVKGILKVLFKVKRTLIMNKTI